MDPWVPDAGMAFGLAEMLTAGTGEP
jgi:hypothetical protein